MIHIPDLTPADVGRWVVYRDHEAGRIKGWGRLVVWVVYGPNAKSDNYADFTGQATDPADLEFEDQT